MSDEELLEEAEELEAEFDEDGDEPTRPLPIPTEE
jgi:hypothetical protein